MIILLIAFGTGKWGEINLAQKKRDANASLFLSWSGELDSNQRPLAPHASTLPNCATARNKARILGGIRIIVNVRLTLQNM